MVYSLEDLKKAYSKGQHYKFLFFWGHTPDSGGRITETCLKSVVDGPLLRWMGLHIPVRSSS